MRRLSSLALAGAVLVAAAPPSGSQLQRSANRLVATSDIPGVIALYEQDGRRTIVAAGEADVARGTELRTGDRFWVGSITKTFVATVVLQLVAEHRLGLDDAVERLLPGRLREGRRIKPAEPA